MKSPYSLLVSPHWDTLLLKSVVFHSTRSVLASLTDHRSHAAVKKVLADLEFVANELSTQSDLDDDRMMQLITSWTAEIEVVVAGLDEECAERTLLQRLLDLCVPGQLSDPFAQLAAEIENQARATYGLAWKSMAIEIVPSLSHPRRLQHPNPYVVSAETPWPTFPEPVLVRLIVQCSEFGPEAFAVVPAVLTHEIVCHVPAAQDRAKNDSPFAEGFMDWVASEFHDDWMAVVDPDLAPAAQKHAQQLKQLELSSTDRIDHHARCHGRHTATILAVWFQQIFGTRNRAVALVKRLAVELNSIQASIVAKDYFVSRISWPLDDSLAEQLVGWERGEVPATQLLALA